MTFLNKYHSKMNLGGGVTRSINDYTYIEGDPLVTVTSYERDEAYSNAYYGYTNNVFHDPTYTHRMWWSAFNGDGFIIGEDQWNYSRIRLNYSSSIPAGTYRFSYTASTEGRKSGSNIKTKLKESFYIYFVYSSNGYEYPAKSVSWSGKENNLYWYETSWGTQIWRSHSTSVDASVGVPCKAIIISGTDGGDFLMSNLKVTYIS